MVFPNLQIMEVFFQPSRTLPSIWADHSKSVAWTFLIPTESSIHPDSFPDSLNSLQDFSHVW